MITTFSELVIEGSFPLVKGFLMGFRSGMGNPFEYFFHRKTGIRRETLKDVLGELFDLENLVHVCVENRVVEALQQAVVEAEPAIGIRLNSATVIHTAEFGFALEVYNQDMIRECRFLTEDLPDGVELDAVEIERESTPRSGHLPAQPLRYAATGRVCGDFGGVIKHYLRCKRSRAARFIDTEEVVLEHTESDPILSTA